MPTDLEKLGLKIAAFIREGALPSLDCDLCKSECKQEKRNCLGEDREEEAFYIPEMGQFTSCPMNFIAPAINDFLDQYKFIERFPHTMKPQEECLPRLWDFIQYYDDCRVEAALSIKKSGGGGSESVLDNIKNRFKKRR